jgi:hypothetical protein
MLKIFGMTFSLLMIICYVAGTARASELDIQWQDKKLSVKAKDVTLCEVLKELGEKTNTKISNANPCDNLINLNIEKKPFDEAIKRILKHDSYVLVDDDTEKRLLIYNRNNTQNGNDREFSHAREEIQPYISEPVQPDSTVPEIQQPHEQYQDASSIDANPTDTNPDEPFGTNTPNQPEPYDSDPSANPEASENANTVTR